jgi:mRNA-degrading endonuclease RelE of RelBE toxin-antitoxin system
VSYAVIWETGAIGLLSRYLDDDSKGIAEVLDAGEALSDDPRPNEAFRYGENDGRLRVGRYRVIYHIDDEASQIHITHVARV